MWLRCVTVAASKVTKLHEQVKTILDTAAGKKDASNYGATACAWSRRKKRPPAATTKAGSARSGLIRGLRGLAPFDGNRFPPLMWGGKRVAEPDIQFIADWIDDGCPAALGCAAMRRSSHRNSSPIGKRCGNTTRRRNAGPTACSGSGAAPTGRPCCAAKIGARCTLRSKVSLDYLKLFCENPRTPTE